MSSLCRTTLPRSLLRSSTQSLRQFHRTTPTMVKEGDSIPSVELQEGSPGNKIDLSKKLTGNGLIIGVPAAFSPSCSETHIPGYINSSKTKSAGDVYVVSVNDAFVMKAWGKDLDPKGESGIHFVADPAGEFTKALDVAFDATPILGNHRSKRYALTVEGGKIKSVAVEPDNTGVTISAVEKVLG